MTAYSLCKFSISIPDGAAAFKTSTTLAVLEALGTRNKSVSEFR